MNPQEDAASTMALQAKKQNEMITKNMFNDCMSQKWKQVSTTFRDHPFARKAKLTRSKDTALHIAINCYAQKQKQSKIHLKDIQSMVKCIPEGEVWEVLTLRNDKGNTPLHLAAQLGDVEICECILQKVNDLSKVVGELPKCLELIGQRNHKKETPLFLAAHRGKAEAFRRLHKEFKSHNQTPIELCRREKGHTILHSTLFGEYFELAFEIITEYEELVNYVNEDGISPLHILARKPHVFRSSSYIGPFETILYYCTDVRPLRERSYDDDENDNIRLPENWRTIWDSLKLIGSTVRDSFGLFIYTLKYFFGEQKPHGEKAIDDPEQQTNQSQGLSQRAYPEQYDTVIGFLKLLIKIVLVVLGIGAIKISNIKEKKEKQTWALQIIDKLIMKESSYMYQGAGGKPLPVEPAPKAPIVLPKKPPATDDKINKPEKYKEDNDDHGNTPINKPEKYEEDNDDHDPPQRNRETPLLAAAKLGIQEIVKKIITTFPVSIQDVDPNHKNVLLLAVENRQISVYKLLLKLKLPEFVYHQVDKEGNSAVHIAAMYFGQQYWRIPGDALQLQGEIKWYKHVKHTMRRMTDYIRYNERGQAPGDVFLKHHEKQAKDGADWLRTTSNSCSVVAGLIATVAYATSATVPGGVDDKTGRPTLEDKPVFNAFAVSSMVALSFSVASLIFFLAILTSRCQQRDFKKDLPRKLLIGLTFLFTSIAAILVSFSAGHFFVLNDKLKVAAVPIYGVVCLPVTFFAFQQLPLYIDLLRSILLPVHLRSYRVYIVEEDEEKSSSSKQELKQNESSSK